MPPGLPIVSDASSLLRGSFIASVAFADRWKPCDIRWNGRSPGVGHWSEVASVSGGSVVLVPQAARRANNVPRMPAV